MIDENFINLLVCPICKKNLLWEQQGDVLRCPQCKRGFLVNEGIVDALVPIEGLNTRYVDLVKRYNSWGKFVTRGDTEKYRRDVTVDLAEGDLLLEIGCAEGFMTGELAKKIPQVVGSDISLNYLKRAKINAPKAWFVRLDVHNIPFEDETFNCIVFTEVLEHLLSPYRALEELYRILKSNGFLVVSVPNNMTPPRILHHLFRKKKLVNYNSAHLNFYDTGSLLQILEITGFKVKEIKTDHVSLPLIRKLSGKFIEKFFSYFGNIIIIKATKKKMDFWEKLDEVIRQKVHY